MWTTSLKNFATKYVDSKIHRFPTVDSHLSFTSLTVFRGISVTNFCLEVITKRMGLSLIELSIFVF